MPRLAHACAVGVGALLLLVGTVAGIVNREVMDTDRFVAHADAVRSDPDVAREIGALLAARLIEQEPDLVAIRPLVETIATGLVGSSALGAPVRVGVAPLHEALVDGDDDPVVLRLADLAAVLVAAVAVVAPDVVVGVPPDLDVRLSELGGGGYDAGTVGLAHHVGVLAWLCPLLGLALLAAAGALAHPTQRVRGALLDLGRGALGTGTALALLLLTVGVAVARDDRDTLADALRRAVWAELSGTFWVAAALAAAGGAAVVLAVGSVSARLRALLGAVVMGVAGLALLLDPAAVAAAFAVLAGVGLVAAAVVIVVVRVLDTSAILVGATVAAAVLVAGLAVGAAPADDRPTPAAADGTACNGEVELCSRAYDEVAYPATHNSMSAASEPGWFFPEQPDGIVDQLDHGIRVLLIDSWYGRETDRSGVVATARVNRDEAIAEATLAFGAPAVESALRLQAAAGLTPHGPVRTYLCHGMCELGATRWIESLRGVRAWLDAHPREVVTVFVQDQVTPEDTAQEFATAGLLPYVAVPPGDGDWPTLGQMIESGRRLVVLMEDHGGGAAYPWLGEGFDLAQDTPFLFRTPDALIDDPDRCAPNRGLPDAPLFLVNHWVTNKTAEVTNATRVNARAVLQARVEECEAQRGQLPNFVAVDFYDRGDLFDVVAELNDR
ncbi:MULTISPECIES: hypothetical protein [unclassified Nocardioides]|uniref:hypothetical protein n=1 Tax=unclassified Nocardioides TaxID=2615069 RepID=UPI00360CEE66